MEGEVKMGEMKKFEEELRQEKWGRALNRVWTNIGGDCLVDENGKPDKSKTMSREDVFEISSDCYFETYSGLSKEEVAEFRKRDRGGDEELMKSAFPFLGYGW